MKQFIVRFSEPVEIKYIKEKFNKETKEYDEIEISEWHEVHEFFSLKSAKEFIKANLDKYVGSAIVKWYANGKFESLGPIKIAGSNKTFMANTKQQVASY